MVNFSCAIDYRRFDQSPFVVDKTGVGFEEVNWFFVEVIWHVGVLAVLYLLCRNTSQRSLQKSCFLITYYFNCAAIGAISSSGIRQRFMRLKRSSPIPWSAIPLGFTLITLERTFS